MFLGTYCTHQNANWMSLCGVASIYVITCRGRVGVVRLFESGPVSCDRPAYMQSRKHRIIALDKASLNMVLKHLIDPYCPRYHSQKEMEHPKYTCTKMNELMRSRPFSFFAKTGRVALIYTMAACCHMAAYKKYYKKYYKPSCSILQVRRYNIN